MATSKSKNDVVRYSYHRSMRAQERSELIEFITVALTDCVLNDDLGTLRSVDAVIRDHYRRRGMRCDGLVEAREALGHG